MVRTPILQTGASKASDSVSLTFQNVEILSDQELVPIFPTGKSCTAPIEELLSGNLPEGSCVDLPADGGPHTRRRLQGADLCMSFTQTLIEGHSDGGKDSSSFNLSPISSLSLSGSLPIVPDMSLKLKGKLCPLDRKMTLSLEASFKIMLNFRVGGEVWNIVKGSVSARGLIFGLDLRPYVTADAAKLSLTGDAEYTVRALNIAFKASLEFPVLKWKKKCIDSGCCGKACATVPDGWKWGNGRSHNMANIKLPTIGPRKARKCDRNAG